MRTLRALTAATALGVVVPLLGVAAAGAQEAASGERYVSFGDSFVSGPGIAPQRTGTCMQSEKNFPSLIADRLGVESFDDASCGAARLDHLWEAQTTNGGTNPPQLDALGQDTTLVTFGTLGGNDVGLVQLAMNCFTATCSGGPDDAAHQRVEALRPVILQGLADTRARAPKADIVVVGYSHYIPPSSCSAVGGIDAGEAVYFQGLVDHLSRVLEESADEAGVAFADLNAIPGVADHTVCAAPEQQWVRAINTYGDGAPLHPSTCGMAAYAQQVERAVQEARGLPVDTFVDPCPASATPPSTPPAGPTPPVVAPAPTVPDTSATLAALRAAADTVRLDRRCVDRKVRFAVRGGRGKVAGVVFRIGRTRIGHDRTAPSYVIKRWQERVSRHPGRVKARVVLRHEGQRLVTKVSAKRPRCMR